MGFCRWEEDWKSLSVNGVPLENENLPPEKERGYKNTTMALAELIIDNSIQSGATKVSVFPESKRKSALKTLTILVTQCLTKRAGINSEAEAYLFAK